MESTAPSVFNEVIEVATETDYTELLNQILISNQNAEYALQMLAGFGLFLVIVLLCYFCYKFFRIFI